MLLDEKQYRIILESSPNMVWRAGTDALCNYFNNTWLKFTGRTFEQELHNGWAEGVHPDDYNSCIKTYLEAFEKRAAFEMEYRLRRYDGEWRWINDRGSPYFDDDGNFAGYIGSCIDVTEKIEGAILRDMAQKDGLTGTYNRQYFEQLARHELQKAKNYECKMGFMMLDLNDFKKINDAYGHQFGDYVLRSFAETLKSELCENDMIGRYGGDEFIILLKHKSEKEITTEMERIANASKKVIFDRDGKSIKVSASYGFSNISSEDCFESIVSKADKNMYRMKTFVHKKIKIFQSI